MAYMSQEMKAPIAAKVKAICKRYGVKASLAVEHHSTLVLNIAEGPIDFIGDLVASEYSADRIASIKSSAYLDVNPYHWRHNFKGRSLDFLSEVMPVLNDGNHDNSDPMTDYFDVGWYIAVHVGRWNKPYRLMDRYHRYLSTHPLTGKSVE